MYFPWIGYLEQILISDKFVFYNDVFHSKGSLLNRVKLKSSNQFSWITIPFEKQNKNKLINQKTISKSESWKSKQISIFKSHYQNAPFMKDALNIIENVFRLDTNLVFEISINSIIEICKYFEIDYSSKIIDSVTLKSNGIKGDRVLKICKELRCSHYITGHGALNYLDHENFNKNKIKVSYLDYQMIQYPQLHGKFYPYVSSLDLIANCGIDGKKFIKPKLIDWKKFKNK